MNINTKEYWDKRFNTRDWSGKGGNIQSFSHAKYFVEQLQIPEKFSGVITDVGCAEGDAIPVYRKKWPAADLKGVDFAAGAIEKAKRRYGHLAEFYSGEFSDVRPSEIIISSHTFEHLENDIEALNTLRSKCNRLFIIVPYRESPIGPEHLRAYDECSYAAQNPKRSSVCGVGWQHSGGGLIYHIYLKNWLRPMFGKPLVRMGRQIIFEFDGLLRN